MSTTTPHSTSPAEPRGLTRLVGAAARGAARRPKLTIALWLALVIGCLVAGTLIAVRWGRRQPPGERGLAIHGTLSTTLSVALILIWAMEGVRTSGRSGRSSLWPRCGAPTGRRGFLAAVPWRSGSTSSSARAAAPWTCRRRSCGGSSATSTTERRRGWSRSACSWGEPRNGSPTIRTRPHSVRRAREEATAAIGELRDLARGIAPPVLADRGLEAAVRITLWAEHGELGIVVADNGLGGADPHGGGLTGLRQRVEALDGWLEVSSPAGEGTTVRASLPCE